MGMKASNAIATFFKYFVLILVGLIMIYPLLWMISATFKDNSEIFAGIGLWIKNPTLEGYKNALNNFGGSINILQAMLNTYSYVLPKVICTVVSSCIAAYGFGRFDFPGRKILFSIMLATLFLRQPFGPAELCGTVLILGATLANELPGNRTAEAQS